jgi:hypothetical protein
MAETLFMQTTEIDPTRSAGEITGLLVRAGARQVATEYGPGGKVIGLRFSLPVAGMDCNFALPARTDPVFKILMKQKPWTSARTNLSPKQYEEKMRDTAERIGWRQLFRWVQAQVAVIDAGMVLTQEVFLPYLIDRTGRTVYQLFEEQKFKMLTDGK